MLNGINNNNELLKSQIDKQNEVLGVATNPIKNPYKNIDKALLIDETAISTEAINLYQKEQDVSLFSKLALSDPNNMSHEEIVASLFSKGVLDPLSDEIVSELSSNQKLWADLGL